MRFWESLLYGLISGLAEFLPVSTQAHQAVCMLLFGTTQREPLRDLMVHIALIFALTTAARSLFARIRREKSLSAQVSRGSFRKATSKSLLDLQFVRTASIPMVVLLLLYLAAAKWETMPVALSIVLILNGIILIVPEYMRHGNKDARTVSTIENVLIGVFSGLSALPGISRVGACLSASAASGADRQNSVNWALMLTLPALVVFVVFDLINLIIYGFAGVTFLAFLGYILSGLMAFVGGYLSVLLLRFITERTDLSAFAFYSWGMALLIFILYMIT